jgi:hypothetical protein
MALASNVFITWSKDRGKAAAFALRGWLPQVIQSVSPWMSEKDIDKGTIWLNDLVKMLASMKLGIVCLTQESVAEPWVLFETGVIFKGLDDGRVWTYLLGGLKPTDVPQPLGLFQHTAATENDTFRLIESMNAAMDDRGISSELLKKQFEKYWPELDKALKELSVLPAPRAIPTTEKKMLSELLELARGQERAVTANARFDQDTTEHHIRRRIARQSAALRIFNTFTREEKRKFLEELADEEDRKNG